MSNWENKESIKEDLHEMAENLRNDTGISKEGINYIEMLDRSTDIVDEICQSLQIPKEVLLKNGRTNNNKHT